MAPEGPPKKSINLKKAPKGNRFKVILGFVELTYKCTKHELRGQVQTPEPHIPPPSDPPMLP